MEVVVDRLEDRRLLVVQGQSRGTPVRSATSLVMFECYLCVATGSLDFRCRRTGMQTARYTESFGVSGTSFSRYERYRHCCATW
jgi:hypothetical protein